MVFSRRKANENRRFSRSIKTGMMQLSFLFSIMTPVFGLMPMHDTANDADTALRIRVENIAAVKGRIHVGIYKDAASFPKKKLAFTGTEADVKNTGVMEIDIPGLSPGRYAVAVFHDLNGNGKLDTNMLGIPTEPYAFSNGAVAKWSSPTFAEAAFELPASGTSITVTLGYWKEF